MYSSLMTRQATVLADGVFFGEGPRWHDGRLWFSDFFAHAIKSVGEAGDVRIEVRTDDQPSGLGWLPDGRLQFVAMTSRTLRRVESDASVTTVADLSAYAPFHCNDMVVDSEGNAFIGHFGFNLDEWLVERGVQATIADHPVASVLRVTPDGVVSVAAADMHFPNGSVITPDGTTMIVAETLGFRLSAFDRAADGSLHNRRVWADLGARAPDGICLDADGHVWVANPLSPECFLVANSPEGGDIIDSIDTGDPCFACMLGGHDGLTLFMLTAPVSLAEVASQAPRGHVRTARVESPGAGRP
jgi:sugar lactone lactonase YvrE